MESHELPADLRSSLELRLSKFLAAETEGNWEQVAELIGPFQFGSIGVEHRESFKQCLVSRMQEIRMVDFDYSIRELSTCSTTAELPTGTVTRLAAERLSWYVRGTARFQAPSEEWTEQTRVVAYRDHGEWYFVSPQRQMQEKWEKVHYTEADFTQDRQDEVEVRNTPSSPIEITDLHVYMNRKFPSVRDLRVKLRNRTSKEIVGLRGRIFMITNGSGEVDWSGPYRIEPKGTIEYEETVSAYSDFCDGTSKHALLIQSVSFSDGSTWELEEKNK